MGEDRSSTGPGALAEGLRRVISKTNARVAATDDLIRSSGVTAQNRADANVARTQQILEKDQAALEAHRRSLRVNGPRSGSWARRNSNGS